MFEHRGEPLIDKLAFLWRLMRAFLFTVVIVVFSMLIGTFGFKWLADAPTWGEVFHDACLILGERPLPNKPEPEAGKFFVGLFVMYSRLVFFAVVMILVMPLLHRLFHKLHLDDYLLANMLTGGENKKQIATDLYS